MPGLTRRHFLAAAAAAPWTAAPRLVQAQRTTAYDVVIIGAGAAGIAAARRLVAAGRSCLVLEAAPRIGGRCFTDTDTFGQPVDLGARLLYQPAVNPVVALARAAGIALDPVTAGHRLRIGQRFAREAEMERHLAALVRARRAFAIGAARPRDAAAGSVLPRDIADQRATVDFALGAFRCGKSLDDISVRDLARSADRDIAVAPRGGLGALLATLAAGLPVQLSTPATRVTLTRGITVVETAADRLLARAVLVTVSTDVITGGGLGFDPALPREHQQAMAGLSLGHRERVAVELAGGALGLAPDTRVIEKTETPESAALHANLHGSPISLVDIPGRLGRELASKGEPALAGFAVDWLAGLFGPEIRKAVIRTAASRWSADPLTRGAGATAAPGVHGARTALLQPARERIHFAGEAAHETLWGTVGGAWISGERAAEAILAQLDGRPMPGDAASAEAGQPDPESVSRRRTLRQRR